MTEDLFERETIRTRRFKIGYELRTELVIPGGPDSAFEIQSAYTLNGAYIGDKKMANFLIRKKGIIPELIDSTHNICQVGFCEAAQKWYGWSHRALCGFGIGDCIFEENWPEATDETPFVSHGDRVIERLAEAREAAANFAMSVA